MLALLTAVVVSLFALPATALLGWAGGGGGGGVRRGVSSSRPPRLAARRALELGTRTLEAELANVGDYVTCEVAIRDGSAQGPLLSTDFDQGEIRLCINGGGFHPGVHQVAGRLTSVGETCSEIVSGGEYLSQATAEVPLASAPPGLRQGDVVKLSNGIKARVTRVTSAAVTIDANPPLAGKSLYVTAKLLSRKPKSALLPFTVACGCFWGVELALQRAAGVVFTAVGYTQGQVESPSYEEVCSGKTGHTEAVTALYDPELTSYTALLDLFWPRHDPTQLNRQGNDRGTQYRGGIYFHNDEQRRQAEESLARERSKHKAPLATELLPASTFWVAESYHQQYLEKQSGQSASKSATETIRCYG